MILDDEPMSVAQPAPRLQRLRVIVTPISTPTPSRRRRTQRRECADRLLDYAVDGGLHVRGQAVAQAVRVDHHAATPLRELGGKTLERRHKADAVEHRRPQAHRQLAQTLEGLVHVGSERAKPGRAALRPQLAAERVEPEQHRGQRLSGLLVPLVRDLAPLALLAVEQPSELPPPLGECPARVPKLGPQRGALAFTRQQALVVASDGGLSASVPSAARSSGAGRRPRGATTCSVPNLVPRVSSGTTTPAPPMSPASTVAAPSSATRAPRISATRHRMLCEHAREDLAAR